jgi:hypothetical protein
MDILIYSVAGISGIIICAFVLVYRAANKKSMQKYSRIDKPRRLMDSNRELEQRMASGIPIYIGSKPSKWDETNYPGNI